jgi:two-component system sensor kinase
LEVAEQQFRIARRGSDEVSPELRFRVHEGLGDVLVLRGRYDEAIEQYGEARSMVEGDRLLARLDFKLGVACCKKGDMGHARDYFEKAIRALGERPPSTTTVIPRAIKEASLQFLHTKFPSRFVGRKDADSARGQLELFRARVFDQLTLSYWFTRGMNFVLWSHLRQMNLAERYPQSPELGKTYAFHAVTMTGIPMAERGIAYARRAYDISVEMGDLWGQGKARSYHTFSCIVLARFKEGVEMGREAVRLLEQAGDVWESNMARMIATVPMYHLGDLEAAYRQSRKAYEIGIETGDYSAVCISLLFWIPNNPKTIPPGVIQVELERHRDDPLTIAGAVYARGLELLLCEDQPREAAEVLQESLDQASRLGLRNVCLFSAATWKATALRTVAERQQEDAAARSRALRDALVAVRAALKITKKYRACRPHALRERGLIAVLEGKEDQARRYFEESLQAAEAHQARYDHAQTLLARGQAGIKFGWPNAAAQAAQAQAVVDSLENF